MRMPRGLRTKQALSTNRAWLAAYPAPRRKRRNEHVKSPQLASTELITRRRCEPERHGAQTM
jgi:hypothetical protein